MTSHMRDWRLLVYVVQSAETTSKLRREQFSAAVAFLVSRSREWSRPDTARTVVGAVPRIFRLPSNLGHPTPARVPCLHGSCEQTPPPPGERNHRH